jgi:hypothetical protein
MELFRTGQITEAFNKKRLGVTTKGVIAKSSLKLLLAFLLIYK